MYKVYCDDTLMCDSRIEELALIDPVVTLEENKVGSFIFTIPTTHPFYDAVKRRKTLIEVYRDEESEPLFSGICTKASDDFYKRKKITCEGELTFFNDSLQRPARYQGKTVRELLGAYIANHNAQVEEKKHFTVGAVTVTDSNDYISCYTNMESTMKALKEDLVDDLGGIFRIRHEEGIRYLDYLEDSPNTNSQIIRIGENLLDFVRNIDSTEIATAVVPLGAKLEESTIEGLETRLTIEEVNDGLDYVCSEEAVETYGWIYKTIEFDDVTTPEALKTKGEKYLSDTQWENVVIEAKAIDLHLTDKDIEQFKISDQIPVVSEPHGLDRYFRLSKMTIPLNKPENAIVTLGKKVTATLSAKTNQASDEIKKAIASIVPENTILKNAKDNATQLITTAMGGYVVKTNDELLIMDTDNIETAKKVWRWNINGLGYSANGYEGPYELAMTMDGSIVADFMKTGSMYADRISGGTLTIGGVDNKKGVFKVLDENGDEVGTWDNSGINACGTFTTKSGDMEMKMTAAQLLYLVEGQKVGGFWSAKLSGIDSLAIRTLNSMFIIAGGTDETTYSGYRFNPLQYETSDGYTERNTLFGTTRFVGDVTLNSKMKFDNSAEMYGTTYDSADAVAVNGGLYAYGSIGCSGTKYRVVETEHYGKVGMNAFETAEAYFADMGSAKIEESGSVTIPFDDKFSETIDTDAEYRVFLTRTSQAQAEWIEKHEGYFIVHGEAGATFDWMLCGKQKGYSDVRMKTVNIEGPKEEGVEKDG